MATIHPTAIVEPTAQLSDTCKIGPHCYIGGHVKIGDGTEIGQGSHITGKTTIGKNNNVYPYCCIGTPPQDVSYKNEMFAVQIGDTNTIREFSTINMGTAKEQGLTVIGNGNFLMAYVHIGHDCVIGNHTVIINNVGLSGHTHVEDHAIISGLTGVHHFVTIGKYAFVGGMSGLYHDVPPYMMVAGNPQKVHRVNTVGLQRHGFTPETIDALKAAHRILYRSKLTRVEAFQMLGNNPSPDVRYLIEFLDRQMNGRQGRQREIIRAGVKH